MDLIVITDFDGTVVIPDTAEFVLDRFADGDWRALDDMHNRGEISIEECMERQFAMVRIPRVIIAKELDSAVTVRPRFGELVEYCRRERIPLRITSAGFDFYIRHFLERNRWSSDIDVVAPTMRVTDSGIRFKFPRRLVEGSVNFKDDRVRYYKRKGRQVAYLGDGKSDYEAVRNADLPFVVKGSKLEEFCDRDGVEHFPFENFREVVDRIVEFESSAHNV